MKLTTMLLGLSLLGCMQRGDTDDDVESAESAVESSDSAEAEGNVMMAAIEGADMTGARTADDFAVRIAANVALRWNPRGCATVRQTGRTITIEYNDCTGPRGVVHVRGRLDLEVGVATTGEVTVRGRADGLEVNRARLDIDTEATYRERGEDRELDVRTLGTGTGARGREVEREGEYRITWNTATQCARIDGSWSTRIGDADRGNDVAVRRCANACPTGTITHRRADATVTIELDGTATARWSGSRGRSGSFELPCGR